MENKSNSKIEIGQPAPSVSLISDSGQQLSLDDFPGKNIILYFYPKDDTPGCTEQAKSFQFKMEELARLNTIVLGISKDNTKSHYNFKTRYELSYNLLSDPNAEVINKYNALVEKSMFGKKYNGVQRTTILMDHNKTIRKIWRNVEVPGHVEEVIEAIKGLQ